MGWSIGFDSNYNRDIGYGVPALCDHPECSEEIDRGLSYVCGGGPYGGEHGCGLYFCEKHLEYSGKHGVQVCSRCHSCRKPFKPKPDILKWIYFKMVDPSWAEWRKENKLTPEEVGMTEDWGSYGLVLNPVKCKCGLNYVNMSDGSMLHDFGCKFKDIK